MRTIREQSTAIRAKNWRRAGEAAYRPHGCRLPMVESIPARQLGNRLDYRNHS